MQSGESGRAVRVAVLFIVALVVGIGWGRGNSLVHAQKSLDPTQQIPDPMSGQDPIMPAKGRPRSMPSIDSEMPSDGMRAQMNEERMKALNEERHKRLEDDVAKLQALTNELKSEIDKANKDELSVGVMRKASEIEKLAHDVQSLMKN